MVTVEIVPTFEGWQARARQLLREGVPPAEVEWRELSEPATPASPAFVPATARVPRAFLDLARQVAGHRDPTRWALLYEILWRLVHDEHDLLKRTTDPQIRRLQGMAAAARREAHHEEVAEMLKLEAEGAGAAAFVPPHAELRELAEAA